MKKLLPVLIIPVLFVFSCSNETENNSSNKNDTDNPQKVNKDIVFKAKTENVVASGEIFQLVYEVNEPVDEFTPPDFKNFDVMSGPASSSYSSTQIINGKSTSKTSVSYTYNISCPISGEFTIPSAEIRINGQIYKSNTVTVKVTGHSTTNQSDNYSNQPNNHVKSGDDIFITTIYSKTSVYKGEWILATTKIYTKVDFQNISEMKFPDYNGFWSEILQAPRQIEFKNEQINGEIYQSAVLKQTMLYAQNPGKYSISPYEIELQLKKKSGKGEDFFGNVIDTYKLVNKKLSTGKQTIIVKPLPPNTPEGFSGITGKNFTVNAEIDPDNIKTDESTNLKLNISGSGNLYLLSDFPIKLPEGLKSFKPELVKNHKNSENGPFAEHIFNYVIVGNTPSQYTIPPIEFIYFDPDKENYVTINSRSIPLNVGQGKSYIENQNKTIIQENKDIRFIKEDLTLKKKGKSFFGKPLYYLTFVILSFLFILTLYFRKKQIEKRADILTNKRKAAGKTSIKKLKTAYSQLEQGNIQNFYKEILNALWNYLTDKISINKEHLTKHQVDNILKEKGVSDEIRKKMADVIELCSYAQYSPSSEESKPQQIYNETIDILNELEKVL